MHYKVSFLDYLRLSSSINWRQTQFVHNTIIQEQGKLNYSDSLTSGTGAGQVNRIFFDAGNLETGQNSQFDLFNLQRQVLDETLTLNFSGTKVKLFVIENTSTGVGQDLFVCGTGNGGLTNIFGYSYLGWIIKPRAYSIFYDRNVGYDVNSEERYFYLYDISGRAPSYEIGIFGVKFE